MSKPELIAIYLTASRGEPTAAAEEVEVVVDTGLSGDRFGAVEGGKRRENRQVTLIEAEALEAVERDYGFSLEAAETRRNLLTRGVPLNHLVGREFTVGSVRLLGTELCEPCGYLEKKLEKPVLKALRHRGGLCARVLEGGALRPGDEIRW